MRRDRFVLDELVGFAWDSAESVEYEAALEAIGEVIARCSAAIATGDSTEDWHELRRRWVRCRQRLDPADHDQVRATHREAADHARTTQVR